MIDSRAIIDPDTKIAPDVRIGPYTIIGPGVEIGAGTEIASHVVIHTNTRMGRNNKISSFAILGGDPQHGAYKGESTYLQIGDDNIFREYCSIHRGTASGRGLTRVGDRNFFMAYAHVAHDCLIGNEVVLANSAGVAGHVTIGDYVVLSPFSGVHQFVHIGAYSFLGGGTLVGQDIPPYLLVTRIPGGPRSLNLIGLKRRGFSDETIRKLRRAFSVVYRQDLKLSDAITKLYEMLPDCPELKPFIAVLENTKRGISRK